MALSHQKAFRRRYTDELSNSLDQSPSSGRYLAIALVAGCTGPFDPNGSICGGIQIVPDGEPTFSITGDFVVRNDPKEEPEVKPHVEDEEVTTTVIDNVVYLFHEDTIRNRPVGPELMETLSHIVESRLPPGTMINVTSGGQHAKKAIVYLTNPSREAIFLLRR